MYEQFYLNGPNATYYLRGRGYKNEDFERMVSEVAGADMSDFFKRYVRAVESSVVHYGDTTLTFLSNLQAADDSGQGLTYISAVAVEEKSVWDYNQGNPDGTPDESFSNVGPVQIQDDAYAKATVLASGKIVESSVSGADGAKVMTLPASDPVGAVAGAHAQNHRPVLLRH